MRAFLAELPVVTSNWHPATLLEALWAAAAFGALGLILLILGFKLFDWLTPKLDIEKELSEKNMAVAIVLIGLFASIGFVVAHSIG